MQQAVIFLDIVVYFCTTFILHKGNYISKSYENIGIKVKKKTVSMVSKSKTYCIDYFLIKILLSLVKFLNIILDEYTFSQSYTSFFNYKSKWAAKTILVLLSRISLQIFDTANIQLRKFRFKGYLCYKTITSKNVLAEARIKNFKQVKNFIS